MVCEVRGYRENKRIVLFAKIQGAQEKGIQTEFSIVTMSGEGMGSVYIEFRKVDKLFFGRYREGAL